MRFLTDIAPIITVVGAVGVAIWQQWKITAREQDERKRELIATRASLPLSLSDIDREVTKALKFVAGTHPGKLSALSPDMETVILANDRNVDCIKDCIRLSTNKQAKPLIYLLERIQVIQARLDNLTKSDYSFKIRKATEYNQMLYDLLFLRELSSRYYQYGRLLIDDVDVVVARESMKNAILFGNFCDDYFSGLHDIAEARAFADRMPEARLFFPPDFRLRRRQRA